MSLIGPGGRFPGRIRLIGQLINELHGASRPGLHGKGNCELMLPVALMKVFSDCQYYTGAHTIRRA